MERDEDRHSQELDEDRHGQEFELICQQLDEFEPLPSVVARKLELPPEASEEREREPLDGLILAGLVTP